MIKKGIILLILSLSLFGCGEVEFSKLKYDENERKYYLLTSDKLFTGKAIEYYEKDKIKSIRNIKRGYLTKYTSYYTNGNIQEEAEGKNGSLDGKLIYYYENGNIESEESYINGKRSSTAKHYYENGNIQEESEYNFNSFVKNGKSVTYYENGNIESEINYQGGVETGDAIYYNEDGSIKQRIKY